MTTRQAYEQRQAEDQRYERRITNGPKPPTVAQHIERMLNWRARQIAKAFDTGGNADKWSKMSVPEFLAAYLKEVG